MTRTRHVGMWYDDTSDEHGWIVSIEDGKSSDTLHVCDCEEEATFVSSVLRSNLQRWPDISREDLRRETIRARISYANR